MKISIQSYRIYGSKKHYRQESPRTPSAKPLVISNYPQANEKSEIILGEFPKDYEIAFQARKAFVRSLADSFIIQANREGEDNVFDDYIQKTIETSELKVSEEDWNCYITFIIDKEIEIEDEYIKNRKYLWLNARIATQLKEEFHQYCQLYLDRLTSLGIIVFGEDIISNIVVEDEIFCAPDKMPFSQFEIKGGEASISLELDPIEEKLDQKTIENLLNNFCKLSSRVHKFFDSARHWYLAAEKETDPWKRFMWGFLVMEILASKISNQLYDHVMGSLTIEYDAIDNDDDRKIEPWISLKELYPPKDRLNLTQKFTIMAIGLKSKTILKDIEAFKKIKKSRDRLSHGDLKNESELPLHEFLPLLRRYFVEAIKFNLEKGKISPLEPPDNMEIRVSL